MWLHAALSGGPSRYIPAPTFIFSGKKPGADFMFQEIDKIIQSSNLKMPSQETQDSFLRR